MYLPKCNLEFLLTEDLVKRASALFGIDEATVKKLNDMSLLNTDYIRDAIFISDYEMLARGTTMANIKNKTYTSIDIRRAIAKKYKTTPILVGKSLQRMVKYRPVFSCRHCGRVMSETDYMKMGGICKLCFEDSIRINL